MSFLSALGKIGAGIAAPFTGGASLAAIPLIDRIGSAGNVLSGAAAGSANQRIAEQPQINQTQALNDKRAMLASLLGGLQDAHIDRPAGSTIPTFNITGGLRPSALTNRDALMKQLGTPIESPKAGTMEKILGGVGLGASVLGALGGKGLPQQPPQSKSTVPGQLPPALSNPNVYNNVQFGGGSSFIDPRTYGGQRIPGVMY